MTHYMHLMLHHPKWFWGCHPGTGLSPEQLRREPVKQWSGAGVEESHREKKLDFKRKTSQGKRVNYVVDSSTGNEPPKVWVYGSHHIYI